MGGNSEKPAITTVRLYKDYGIAKALGPRLVGTLSLPLCTNGVMRIAAVATRIPIYADAVERAYHDANFLAWLGRNGRHEKTRQAQY